MSRKVSSPSKARTTVLSLPFVFLEQIMSYLDGYDIFALYASGDKKLIGTMAGFGAVKSIKLLFRFTGSVGVPFGFGGLFPCLTKFHISYELKRSQFYRYPNAYTDICTLPPTLTDLHIEAENVLALFYERQVLSLGGKTPRLCGSKLKYGSDPPSRSTQFYNLDEIFPNLKSLSLGHLHGFSYPNKVTEDIISAGFVRSFPRGLEKLHLMMGMSWPLQCLLQLPPSLKELHLPKVHYDSTETIWDLLDSNGFESEYPLSFVPLSTFLPPSLKKLTMDVGVYDQPYFQSSIEELGLKIITGEDFVKKALPGLPTNLQSFYVGSLTKVTGAELDLLPRSLTSLRLRWPCYHVTPESFRWPSTLRVLEFGLADGSQLTSLAHLLDLHALTIHGNGVTGKPFWPDKMSPLPPSLKVLILSHCILMEQDLAVLPRGLAQFEMQFQGNPDLNGPASNYFVRPEIFPPNLLSLALILEEPPNMDFAELISCVPRTVRSLEISLCQPTTNHVPVPVSVSVPGMPLNQSESAESFRVDESSRFYSHLHQEVRIQSHLTSLILRSFQAPTNDFYSLLPRFLTKLHMNGQGRAAPIPVLLLPPSLITLIVPSSKIDATEFKHLPTCLKTLHVQVFHNPEKETISPSECAASLPTSLTDLHLLRATINQASWGEETFPFLPRTLLVLNLTELYPRFWAVCPDHLPRQIARALAHTSLSSGKLENTILPRGTRSNNFALG